MCRTPRHPTQFTANICGWSGKEPWKSNHLVSLWGSSHHKRRQQFSSRWEKHSSSRFDSSSIRGARKRANKMEKKRVTVHYIQQEGGITRFSHQHSLPHCTP